MTQELYSFVIALVEPAPPSVNHLYVTGYHGRRVLSREGVVFKDALTRVVVEECMLQNWKAAVDAVYDDKAWIDLTLVLSTDLFNGSWKPGRKTKKGARASPYRKKDLSSYVKVIEDAIVEGTGIDDSAHLNIHLRKVNGPARITIGYEVRGVQ